MKKQFILTLVFIFILMFSILSVNMVLGQTFKQNDIIDLKVQCILNGTYCPTGVCNMTVAYPNNTIFVNSQLMTNQFSFYNYTLNTSSITGYYSCSATCCSSGYCNTDNTCSFNITGTGFNLDTGTAILYFVGLAFSFIVFLGLLYFAIITPFRNGRDDEDRIVSINDLKYLKVFFIVMCYLAGLFTVGLIYSIMNSFLYVNGISQMFSWIYYLLLYAMYPMIVLWVIIAFIMFLNDLTAEKKMKRRNYR